MAAAGGGADQRVGNRMMFRDWGVRLLRADVSWVELRFMATRVVSGVRVGTALDPVAGSVPGR